MNLDPKVEKFYNVFLYSYALNNLINLIDTKEATKEVLKNYGIGFFQTADKDKLKFEQMK